MLKKIAILIGIVWILIFTIWIALTTVLFFKRDEIGQYIIVYLNQHQNGELNVDQVAISTIRQFPHISVILENATYFEHKTNQRSKSEQPIARIENFYCGLELVKLFKGELQISKVNVSGGEISIIIYPDSSVNILNAFKSDSVISKKKSIQSPDKNSRKSAEIISIENLEINDLRLVVTNKPDKKESSVLINNFESAFEFKDRQANLNFTTSLLIEKLKINNDHFIRDQEINLDVVSHLDREKGIDVKEGKLEIAGASFNFNGFFNPMDEGNLYLKIVSDGSLNILSLLTKENVSKNLNKGNFFFFGSIEGKLFTEFPLISMDFGFEDVELINPLTKRTIKNLNLKGFFNSGRSKDLSKASLQIDTLFADFPKGHLNLAGTIKDFTNPEFDINLLLDADLTGLDEILKLGSVDSIKGKIVIKDRVNGKYNISNKKFNNNINEAEISFENFGFLIPGIIKFDSIDGTISGNDDKFLLIDLRIKSETTDFIVNGEIENFQYLIFNIEKEITANLAIKSSIFDLPNFLSFDPSIKRDFPHRILNLDLIVNATTTTSKALHFKSFPQIDFNIKKLKATAEGFLPTININSGIFKISESALGFHMDFEKFKTVFLDGRFDINGSYNSSSYQPYYIKSDIVMDGINISKLIE